MTDSPLLPPDIERLQVIRTYLQLQLAAVDAAIAAAETGAQPWLATPATAWRLQHLPSAAGRVGRGVLHRDDCWFVGGAPIGREEAVIALGEPGVEACDACHPKDGLQP
ncbi:DUF6233 domain-containing protein [Actinacidiphila oryziradicis]|uniref:DUF6233 domain-containing protein n=1 Tax=Actinacidiphila oryziradicis TaxID=2571141 RepID=UPI0023F0A389|nr:DUF6233 domain-containing protein [Actinacidiphila oryziradicis]MCW2870102.1 hypothetical protein [Actinacidiphila oryziradicis]